MNNLKNIFNNKINTFVIIFTIIIFITSCCININRYNTKMANQKNILEKTESQELNYKEIFDDVEFYQAKYWEIIKRNNVLLVLGDMNNDQITDSAELSALFTVVENKIKKDNYYFSKLKNIQKKDNAETQIEMSMDAEAYNNSIDEVLNELYKDIKNTIPTDDFEKLKQSEIKWLKDIEAYKKVIDNKQLGTIGGIVYPYTIANMREFRILLLIPYLKNKPNSKPSKNQINTNIQKSDYLGNWEDLYSQRAQLEISDFSNYTKAEINWSSSAVENTKWIFECQYENNIGNLNCKNGKKIEQFPVKNGVRVYGYPEDENYNVEEEIVEENLQTTIKITKGNLKNALDVVGYIGDKDEALKFYKNMTLKINLTGLNDSIFVK